MVKWEIPNFEEHRRIKSEQLRAHGLEGTSGSKAEMSDVTVGGSVGCSTQPLKIFSSDPPRHGSGLGIRARWRWTVHLGPTVNDAGDERRECFCHSRTVAAGMFSAGCWGDRREEHVELVKRK